MLLRILTLACLLVISGLAAGDEFREVRGVELPLRVTVHDTELALNGAGVRSRFFVRVYVGALYTAEPVSDGDTAIHLDSPRRIHLAMLRGVGRDTMVDALEDGLDDAMTDQEREQHADNIEAFKNMFPGDFEEGYRGDIDAIPGEGLVVSMNDEELGRIEDDDFARFVLAIWLGDNPADNSVKRGMLGDD